MCLTRTLNTPAIAEEPTCKRAVWGHPLHNAGGQQADHQLNSHQCLCEQRHEIFVSILIRFSKMHEQDPKGFGGKSKFISHNLWKNVSHIRNR